MSICAHAITDKQNSRDIGTARRITDPTLIFVLYASNESKPEMPQDLKDRFLKNYERSMRWLSLELNFRQRVCELADSYHADFRVRDSLDVYITPPKTIVQELLGRNYRTILHDKMVEHDCTSYLVLIVTDGKDISHAYKDNASLHAELGYDYVEGCNINCKGSGNLSAKLIHEILHCFGAWDLYPEKLYQGPAAKYRNSLKMSIMYNTSALLPELIFDDLTKYLIGYSDTCYPWFDLLAENGAY